VGSIGCDTLFRGARLLTILELSYPTTGKFVPTKIEARAAFVVAIIVDNPRNPLPAGAASDVIGYAGQATVLIIAILSGIIPCIGTCVATRFFGITG
jgi:hypothetical protein